MSAGIGHNNPPEPTPLEAFTAHIGDLYEAAQQFLDGAAIETQEEADAVSRLLGQLRTAAKDADKARAEEKKPHADAAKAVDAQWKPLTEKADRAVGVAKRALALFLEAQEAEKCRAAEDARKEAEAAREAARQALGHADSLEAREDAEKALKEAKRLEGAANRAEKERPSAAGDVRAVTLRSVWTPTISHAPTALKHYTDREPGALMEWLLAQAARDVRNGARQIPGFEITETKTVV